MNLEDINGIFKSLFILTAITPSMKIKKVGLIMFDMIWSRVTDYIVY